MEPGSLVVKEAPSADDASQGVRSGIARSAKACALKAAKLLHKGAQIGAIFGRGVINAREEGAPKGVVAPLNVAANKALPS